MYCNYWNARITSTSHRYPNYVSSNNRRARHEFGNDHSPPIWNEYTYGRNRNKPYSWQRDSERISRIRTSAPIRAERSRDYYAPPPPSVDVPKPELPKEELRKVLTVKDIDLRIQENTKKHRPHNARGARGVTGRKQPHNVRGEMTMIFYDEVLIKTDKFECTSERTVDEKTLPAELVVRRGDSIRLTVLCDRPFEKEKDDLKLGVSIGEKPAATCGTQAEFKVDEIDGTCFQPDEWGANIEAISGNDITLMLHIPANCIVGEWNLCVKTFSSSKDDTGKDTTLTFKYQHYNDITILFNPWCKDDGVYMATEDLLNEYALNDSGCVYRGNAWTIGAKSWNYGQFKDGVIEAALFIMRNGTKEPYSKALSDPVKVSRVIAKMINVQDDDGVLIGNWSGNYEDGVPPTKWVGSVKILKQYMESGSVKYGQCWVFACVTTTVCRALGIPCRTVTNFASAHDTDESNTIDVYFARNKETGNLELANVNWSSDSVWNFHVWNEVWLARADLNEKELDGWQVIDATPQEASDGVCVCGPCPVAAIKRGLCNYKFDTSFVFSEVNADKISWEITPGGIKKIKVDKNKIGLNISTKKPDGLPYVSLLFRDEDFLAEKRRLDITDEYKFPEGSEEERNAVMMAYTTAQYPRPGAYDDDNTVKQVEFKLLHNDEVVIGSDLSIELIAKNNGPSAREITFVEFRVAPKIYTGETGKCFFRKKFDRRKLDATLESSFKDTLTANDYLPNLEEMANLCIEVTAVVGKLNDFAEQTTIKSHDFRFRRPYLKIEGPEKGHIGELIEIVVSFTNPLPYPLTHCDISMESTGFIDFNDIVQPDVPANGLYEQKFHLTPENKGEHAVHLSFDSQELKDISGSLSVQLE